MSGLIEVRERNELIQRLAHDADLQTPLAIPRLFQSADLEFLIPRLNLGGALNHESVIRQMITVLEEYGAALRNGPTALGLFLYQWIQNKGQGDATRLWIEDLIRRRQLLGRAPDTERDFTWKGRPDATYTPEAINHTNTLRSIAFFAEGLRRAQAVVQIEVPQVRKGTGFLVGPTMLLTCHHVLTTAEEAQRAIFRLNYQQTFDGRMEPAVEYQAKPNGIFYTIDADPHGVIYDFTLVELATPPGQPAPGDAWGYLTLAEDVVPTVEGNANIVQHPLGLPKQVSFQNNVILFVSETEVQYRTTTVEGASGAPVFDDQWRVIALHRGTKEARDPMTNWPLLLNVGTASGAIIRSLPPHIRNKLG